MALSGCEVWGPLINQEFTKWDKHQIENSAEISSVYNVKHQIMQSRIRPIPINCQNPLYSTTTKNKVIHKTSITKQSPTER
jgi:hypothetical protein